MNISVDFETFYRTGKNAYSVKGLGNWAYCNHPEFDAYLIAVSDGKEAWAGSLADFDWRSLEGHTLWSHNAGFDRAVYRRLVQLGIAPPGLDVNWHCTADLSSYLCGRRALSDAAEYLLGVKLSKGVRDRAAGKTWADMIAEGWAEDMITYGRADAVHCHAIAEKYGPLWPDKEKRLSQINIRQGQAGVGVDIPLLKTYIGRLEESLFAIDRTLPWIEEGMKPTSPKGLAEHCRRNGIPCPPLKTEDEEGFDEWEAKFAPRFPWVAQISNRRSINKALAGLRTVEERLRPDGTMGFSMKYFGGHTGRYSGDAGFNMQNLKKVPILLTDERLPLTDPGLIKEAEDRYDETGSWGEYLEIDARRILRPRNPNNKFILCDLSQIEPRVLNWLAGNDELLARIRGGMAIYEAHARDSMGWTGGNLKKEDKKKYAMAKVRVLGLGYQCGADKFVTVAWVMGGLRITVEESSEQVKDFRATNPKIVSLWGAMQSGLQTAASNREDFVVTLPSGRSMVYERPVIRQVVEADEEGKPRKRTQIFAKVGGRYVAIYGGKVAENITQAASRDVFVEHLLDLEDNSVDVVWSVHDEAITEVPQDFPACEVERIMSRCPDWLPGCPIAAEAQEAQFYKK